MPANGLPGYADKVAQQPVTIWQRTLKKPVNAFENADFTVLCVAAFWAGNAGGLYGFVVDEFPGQKLVLYQQAVDVVYL